MGKYNKTGILVTLEMLPPPLFAHSINNAPLPNPKYKLSDMYPYSFGRSKTITSALLLAENIHPINSVNHASFNDVDSNELMFENTGCYFLSWSNTKFLGIKRNFLTDLNKFAACSERENDNFSIKSFTCRVAYRAGLKYEQTYLKFNNHRIYDFGITFGHWEIDYHSKSTINVEAEFGKKDTTGVNLVLENYFN
jgi:hypothetical protein